jgi:hypothetical protein
MSKLLAAALVVLGLPKRNKDLVAFARTVLLALTNNPRFPAPNPSLAVLSADVTAFDQAETAATGKAPSTASQRDVKRAKVVQDLRHIRDYVQGVVEASPSDAITTAESAGMRIKKQSARSKQALDVKDGAVTGTASLVAKAVASIATYFWRCSLDGKTWTSAPETMKAATTVVGLTPGQSYSFRVRTLTRAGASDFSQVVVHIVK